MLQSALQAEKLSYNILEAAAVTGLSRASLYRAIGEGRLIPAKCGRSTLILRRDLESFLSSLSREQDPKEIAHGRMMAAARRTTPVY